MEKIEFTKKEEQETNQLQKLLATSSFFVNSTNISTLFLEAMRAFIHDPKEQLINRYYKSGASISAATLAMLFLSILLIKNATLDRKRTLPSAYIIALVVVCICSVVGNVLLIISESINEENWYKDFIHIAGGIMAALFTGSTPFLNSWITEADKISLDKNYFPNIQVQIPGLTHVLVNENEANGLYNAVIKSYVDNDISAEGLKRCIDDKLIQQNQKVKWQFWYTDVEIDFLLKHFCSINSNIELLTSMLGTSWRSSSTLADNLAQFLKKREEKLNDVPVVKNQVLIPFNLKQTYWILINIIFNDEKNTAKIIEYFDPFGIEIPNEVIKALGRKDIFQGVKVVSIYNENNNMQNDNHNSGPWLIEIAKAIAEEKELHYNNFDIEKARTEHFAILNFANIKKNLDDLYYPANQRLKDVEKEIMLQLERFLVIIGYRGKVLNKEELNTITKNPDYIRKNLDFNSKDPIFIYYNEGNYGGLKLNEEEKFSAKKIFEILFTTPKEPRCRFFTSCRHKEVKDKDLISLLSNDKSATSKNTQNEYQANQDKKMVANEVYDEEAPLIVPVKNEKEPKQGQQELKSFSF